MKSALVQALLVVLFTALIIAAAVLLSDRPEREAPYVDPRATSFSTSASGTKAMYLVLQRFLPSVDRWMKPFTSLPMPGKSNPNTLLVTNPLNDLDSAEASALVGWLGVGGQLILAAADGWPVSPSAVGKHSAAGANTSPEDFLSRFGLKHSPTATGLLRLEDSEGSLLLTGHPLEPGDYQALFEGPGGNLAAEVRVGKGRILLICDGDAWSNERLSRSLNAGWLVSTLLSSGDARLLVDEYHQGFRQGGRPAFALVLGFLGTSWGTAFIQLGAAGALFLAARARRFGPLLPQPAKRGGAPLQRIRSIAAFLEAARASNFAARVILQLAERRLGHARSGLALPQGSVSAEELVEIARRAGELVKEHAHAGQRRS
jgi:hypothetical protein